MAQQFLMGELGFPVDVPDVEDTDEDSGAVTMDASEEGSEEEVTEEREELIPRSRHEKDIAKLKSSLDSAAAKVMQRELAKRDAQWKARFDQQFSEVQTRRQLEESSKESEKLAEELKAEYSAAFGEDWGPKVFKMFERQMERVRQDAVREAAARIGPLQQELQSVKAEQQRERELRALASEFELDADDPDFREATATAVTMGELYKRLAQISAARESQPQGTPVFDAPAGRPRSNPKIAQLMKAAATRNSKEYERLRSEIARGL